MPELVVATVVTSPPDKRTVRKVALSGMVLAVGWRDRGLDREAVRLGLEVVRRRKMAVELGRDGAHEDRPLRTVRPPFPSPQRVPRLRLAAHDSVSRRARDVTGFAFAHPTNQFDHRIRGIERAGRGQRVDRRSETLLLRGVCVQRDLPPEMAVRGIGLAERFDPDDQPERTVEQPNPPTGEP